MPSLCISVGTNEVFLLFFVPITFFIECGTALLPCDHPQQNGFLITSQNKSPKKEN